MYSCSILPVLSPSGGQVSPSPARQAMCIPRLPPPQVYPSANLLFSQLLPSHYCTPDEQVFGKMFTEGHIFRGRKPVNWSPSSRTALAEAELEYPAGHTSTSVYAAFEVCQWG